MGLQADRRVQQRHAGSNRIVYWNALESTEHNNAGIAADGATPPPVGSPQQPSCSSA